MQRFIFSLLMSLLFLHVSNPALRAGEWAPPHPTPSTRNIPLIIERLQNPDRNVQKQALIDAGLIGREASPASPYLINILKNGAMTSETRSLAATALGQMGSAAKPAIPYLVEMMRTERISDNAILPETPATKALAFLCSPLHRIDPVMMRQAVRGHRVIKRAGIWPGSAPDAGEEFWDDGQKILPLETPMTPEGKQVATTIMDSLHAGTATLPMLHLLSELGPCQANLYPTVMHFLDDSTPTLPVSFVPGLTNCHFKPVTPDFIPRLVSMLREATKNQQRIHLLWILRSFGPDAAPVVPELLHLMDLPEFDQRYGNHVMDFLAEIGPDAAPAVPKLIECLRSSSSYLRQEAARALGEIGPGAVAAVPLLCEIAKNSEPANYTATRALDKIAPDRPEVIAVMFEILKSNSSGSPTNDAAAYLGRVGRHHPAVIRRLIDGMENPQNPNRYLFVLALCDAGPAAGAAVPKLVPMFGLKDSMLRRAAAEALAFIGDPALPALLKAMHSSDVRYRYHAAYALGKIGPKQSEVMVALLKALQDEEIDVRRSAIRALGTIGPEAAPAVPALVRFLQSKDRAARPLAATALGEIGLRDPAVLDALSAALMSGDDELRTKAERAIRMLKASS